MASQSFRVSGLSCASCVGRVERAIGAVPGVAAARANLATHLVTVDGSAPLADLVEAAGKAGYPASTVLTRLDVAGMSCASCVNRIETALAATPGVLGAKVNFATRQAEVEHLDGEVTRDALIAAVRAAGYEAVPHAEAPAPGEAAEDAAARGLLRQVIIAAALTLPVFLLEMSSHFIPGAAELIAGTIGQRASWLVQFVLTTLVLAGPGRIFFAKGIPALLRGAPEMNSLVALGTLAAWGYSTAALFAPGMFPAGTLAVYFEAAAVIATLILLGRWLEARARGRTGAAIARLVGLRPTTARILRGDGRAEEIPLSSVQAGDILEVRPGERLPVDGVVVDGVSWVDESMITGEPVPVQKTAEAALTGGTVNGNGALTMRAEAVGDATVLSQIIRMVEAAQGAKLPIQALVDRVTAVFVPAVLLIALIAATVWLVLAPSLALVVAVSVLIVACPCAMGLATPTSIMVGTGRAAELGVLFRGGDALQALPGVRVVALDKTGTLTEGRPELTALEVAPGWTRDEVLRLAAAAESRSEHPIAGAVMRAAEGMTLPRAEAFAAEAGMGVTARIEGRRVLVGAHRFLTAEGIDTAVLRGAADRIAAEGRTPLWLAVDGAVAAAMGVDDPVKASTPAAIAALHEMGLKVAMITGDADAVARRVADRLGIDHVVAEVLPGGKVDAVRALREAHGAIAFVGDGINDAPALAEADVGIAIGTGTDVAVEAADVVLMSGELDAVTRALAISRATMTNIRQNLFWAFAYNVALIPVAAGVLYPLFGLLLSPMLAAGAMALSSVFVLSNALRLRRAGAPAPLPATSTNLKEAPA